jgi:hypothetical protein
VVAPTPAASTQSHVLEPWHKVYCGDGVLSACRQMLLDTLRQALAVDPATLYKDSTCASAGDPGARQKCYDAISFRAAGATSQPLMAWVNRPTYQQADEIQSHRPR